MSRWYVIHCHPNGERKAMFHLRRQGHEVYLPLYKQSRRRAVHGIHSTSTSRRAARLRRSGSSARRWRGAVVDDLNQGGASDDVRRASALRGQGGPRGNEPRRGKRH